MTRKIPNSYDFLRLANKSTRKVDSIEDISNSHSDGETSTHGIDPSMSGSASKASSEDAEKPILSYNQSLASCPPSFGFLNEAPPSDHHFLAKPDTKDTRAWFQHMCKEYQALDASLPSGIFARTWESRMDLMRVLIIGAHDTPYEYAPFVFDFYFPSDYPRTPPVVFFHSWNADVNPNLYPDGTVCLSLLGTWEADDPSQTWCPGESTLLQVFVSIQALVLVEEPYFSTFSIPWADQFIQCLPRLDEPDLDEDDEFSAEESEDYNQRVFLKTRKFITHALEEPVVGLQDVVAWNYLSGLQEEGQIRPRLLHTAVDNAFKMLEHYYDRSFNRDAGSSKATKYLSCLHGDARAPLHAAIKSFLEIEPMEKDR